MRLAIVGAGPAGIYTADLLLNMRQAAHDLEADIDLFDQLPAPYGLVRYGVAPDHPRIKGIVESLRQVLDHPRINFYGNVRYGQDLSLDDLRRHYHAVVFSTGANRDAALDIPGIDAEGSYGAADFVSWFDGHPDVPREWPLTARQVAVVGNGNVALDISRILVKRAEDLRSTEIPESVYRTLQQNPLEELHLFGRRGPLYAKFTPLELRELGEVPGVELMLNERDFEVTDQYADDTLMHRKQVLVLSRIIHAWRERQRVREATQTPPAARKLHLHFWSAPTRVLRDATGRVAGIEVERTAPDGHGGVFSTGELTTVPVQALYRAVGYFGSALKDVPFDEQRGVIPNERGRVLDPHGIPLPGIYTTGWVARGPVGLIGHTKSDAKETLACLLADRETWWRPETIAKEGIPQLLADRGVPYTTAAGWHRLDAHERALGAADSRERIKVVPRSEMVRISHGEVSGAPNCCGAVR